MANIIIAFPKIEDAKAIRNIVVRSGFSVQAVCTSGAQAIAMTDGLADGIIICGYKLQDMLYAQLKEDLPKGFEMILMASPRLLSECFDGDVVCLSMPLKITDLVNTLHMIDDEQARRRRKRRQQPKVRTEEEEQYIREAKELLMGRNHLSEEEAHRYLQKNSMDSGVGIVEMAQMVLMMKT